jgi:hypothetical protein
LRQKEKIQKLKEKRAEMIPNYFFCVRIFNKKVCIAIILFKIKLFILIIDYRYCSSYTKNNNSKSWTFRGSNGEY